MVVNEFNLVQRPRAEQDTLDKMRKKLATARPEPLAPIKPMRSRGKLTGAKSLSWVLLAAGALVSLNFIMVSNKEIILQALDMQTIVKPLSPPSGLSRDDQARFWALAAFDSKQLREKFSLAKNAVVDPLDAQHHLDHLLSKNLGNVARAEVLAMKKKHGLGTIR